MGCLEKTIIKDETTSYICRELSFETQDRRVTIVFVNCEYWGMYGMREYYDDNHFNETYGVPKDSVNIVLH